MSLFRTNDTEAELLSASSKVAWDKPWAADYERVSPGCGCEYRWYANGDLILAIACDLSTTRDGTMGNYKTQKDASMAVKSHQIDDHYH